MCHNPEVLTSDIRGEEKYPKTLRGIRDAALRIAEQKPKTIVVITQHGPVFEDAVSIFYETRLSGNLAEFGEPEISVERECDMALIDELRDRFDEEECRTVFLNDKRAEEYGVDVRLDYGAIVPLYYIQKVHPDFKIVHITIGYLSLYELYRMGRLIRQAVEVCEKDAVILASGDLSHRLKDREADPFDSRFIDALRSENFYDILTMPAEIYIPAEECGLRPAVMAFGALDGIKTKTEILSYENAGGIGCLSSWTAYDLSDEDPTCEGLLKRFDAEKNAEHEKVLESADPYVGLAMNAIETWVRDGRMIAPRDYLKGREEKEDARRMLEEAAGVYIIVYKSGELRGGAGTTSPVTACIADEIVRNAINAAAYDSRFLPVEKEELNQITVSVSILGVPEDTDASGLDPKKFGVIAEKGLRRGVLLPNIEGIDTVDEQIAAVKRKAGIPEYEEDEELGEKLFFKRFTVEAH